VRERNKITSPLKKKVEKLEEEIIKLEELVALQHKELVELSNSGESSKLMELSKTVAKNEEKVEHLFEELSETQNQLDAINEEYEEKMEGLE
jgi:ATP-binding cassette subfamily F protein 3